VTFPQTGIGLQEGAITLLVSYGLVFGCTSVLLVSLVYSSYIIAIVVPLES